MKKLLIAAMLCAPMALAYADYGQSANPTVQNVLSSAKDHQSVVLRGHIVKKISGEKYEFADATGSIVADIDKKYFPAGQAFDGQALVEITGVFDKAMMGKSKVEVKEPVRVLQAAATPGMPDAPQPGSTNSVQ